MKIKKEVVKKLVEHARRDAPIEACGYLASSNGVIAKHYELRNIDQSREHFSFDPQEQFSVLKDSRANNLEIAAVYHSHPETPARPSVEDIRLAHDPKISHLIISLADQSQDLRSFKIKDSQVSPENLEVV